MYVTDNNYLVISHSLRPNAVVCLCSAPEVFQDAIQSPSPAFRYFTSGVMPPLTKLKITEPDGSQYISAMSRIIFSTEEQ